MKNTDYIIKPVDYLERVKGQIPNSIPKLAQIMVNQRERTTVPKRRLMNIDMMQLNMTNSFITAKINWASSSKSSSIKRMGGLNATLNDWNVIPKPYDNYLGAHIKSEWWRDN